MRLFRKFFPYIALTILVVIFWYAFTQADRYVRAPQGKQLAYVEIALSSIFLYKSVFWVVIANATLFTLLSLYYKRYKTAIYGFAITMAAFGFGNYYVNRWCAPSYYSVFVNQSVPGDLLKRPIWEAGYSIGPILSENIRDSNMEYRRYAISGLADIKYVPAVPMLNELMLNKVEHEDLRADAYAALLQLDIPASKKALTDFERLATDSASRRIIKEGKNRIYEQEYHKQQRRLFGPTEG